MNESAKIQTTPNTEQPKLISLKELDKLEGYECSPINDCEPCTEDEILQYPQYCTPFTKSKQKFECIDTIPSEKNQVKVLVYKECPIVLKEVKLSFFKFQTLILVLLVISLLLIFFRKRKLRADQYRRLRMRIGS